MASNEHVSVPGEVRRRRQRSTEPAIASPVTNTLAGTTIRSFRSGYSVVHSSPTTGAQSDEASERKDEA